MVVLRAVQHKAHQALFEQQAAALRRARVSIPPSVPVLTRGHKTLRPLSPSGSCPEVPVCYSRRSRSHDSSSKLCWQHKEGRGGPADF